MVPDFLVIGHVARDVGPDGPEGDEYALGGTVTYAAAAALRLGLRSAVLTSAATDIDLARAFPEAALHVIPAPATTTFRNEYGNGRRQRLYSAAGPITEADVPDEWRRTPMVLLGPLVGELATDLGASFPDSIVVASMQGWLRHAGPDRTVTQKAWEGDGPLPNVAAAIVSDEDADPSEIETLKGAAPTLIVTEGARGARLYSGPECRRVPAFAAAEVDPTGAGDVFAAAFLVRLTQTSDPVAAATFASCTASLSVEAAGIDAVPDLAQVERRMAAHGRTA